MTLCSFSAMAMSRAPLYCLAKIGAAWKQSVLAVVVAVKACCVVVVVDIVLMNDARRKFLQSLFQFVIMNSYSFACVTNRDDTATQ